MGAYYCGRGGVPGGWPSSRTPSPHRVATLPLSRLVTRNRYCHTPPSRNSVSEGDLKASQSAAAVAAPRS
eukprot:3519083-Prymnesium_polylepis.1